MFALNNVELILLFLVIFIAVYFIYERVILWKKIVAWHLPNQIKDFVIGMLLGLTTLFVYWLNKLIWSPFEMPLFMVSTLMIAYFKNYISALYSMIPMIIYWGLLQGGSTVSITSVTTLFVMLIFIELLKWFGRKELVVIMMFAYSLAVVDFLILFFIFEIDSRSVIENLVIPLAASIVCIFIMKIFINFSISSRVLYESSNFMFKGFYRSGIAENAFKEWVKNHHIEKAIFGMIRVDFENKGDSQHSDEIARFFVEIFRENLGDSYFYFGVSENVYGFAIPFDGQIDIAKSIAGNALENREPEDMLQELQMVIQNAPIMIKTSWDEVVEVSSKVGVTLYGVESCAFDELTSHASFALMSFTSKNIVSIYNPKEQIEIRNNNRLLSLMDKQITLDDYVQYFVPLYDLKAQKEAFTYSIVRNISEFDYYETINEIIYSKGWEQTFNRYFAAEALKKASGKKVGFDYSLTIFENNFDLKYFTSFIADHNNKFENLYLFIVKESFDKVRDFEKVKAVLAKLTNINFVIDNQADKGKVYEIFDKVNYSFKSVGDATNNFPGSIVIATDVNNETDIKKVRENKIEIFGGGIIENKITFTNLDKQSKIYLESILKKGG